jgi:hypothetical protein
MTRAIRTGGWTILLLSTVCGSTLWSQRVRVRGVSESPAATPAPAAQPAVSPQATPAQPAPAQPVPSQPVPSQPASVAPSMLQQPAQDAQIVFANGNLSIHAENSSLAAILNQVASNSGMKIEGLGSDERVFGNFGPGAPRDVLADLLVGTSYNQVLLGDLSNGAPRELILSPTRSGATVPSPAPQASANANAEDNEPEAVEAPPPPPPQQEQPAGSAQQPPPGVRTPQQLFEQLQQMRAAQGRGQQQQQQPVQQDSPMQ